MKILSEAEKVKQYHLDKEIISLYSKPNGRGEFTRFCKSRNLGFSVVRRRAIKLNVYIHSPHIVKWTNEEVEFMKQNQNKAASTISKYFKSKLGVDKSVSSVWNKMQRLKLTGNQKDGSFTQNELAMLMGVSHHVVALWTAKGLLKAKKMDYPIRQNEGSKKKIIIITPKNVVNFIKTNAGIINLGKVNAPWFIDLLTNKKAG